MTEENKSQAYAGFWIRVASIFVDTFIITCLMVLAVALITPVVHSRMAPATFLRFILFFMFGVSLTITVVYFAWFNANRRQSPGKKMFGIVVLDDAMRGISFSQSLTRSFVYLFDYMIFGLGHLLIVFHKKKRAFHDLVAKTVVVRIRSKNKFEPLLILATIVIYFFVIEVPQSLLKKNYVQAYRIPTGSLKPTLMGGDFILVDKYSPTSPKPVPSEWLIFRYPRDEIVSIKRCIATEGQMVEIKEDRVYVDGRPEGQIKNLGRNYDAEEGRHVEVLQVDYEGGKKYLIRQYADDYNENYGPMSVPEHHYFVLGDNRDNSADSRAWGSVPEEKIIGKGAYIYFSWDSYADKVRWSRIGTRVE